MKTKKRERDYLYAVPFSALILFATLNFSTGGDQALINEGSRAFTIYIRIAIYALAFYPLFVKPAVYFPWLIKRWPFLALLVFVPVSFLWSSHPGSVIENTIHLIGGSLCAFSASIYYSKYQERIFILLPLTFGIAIIVSLVTIYITPDIGIATFEWEETSRWRGATGNPNTLGRLSTIAVWASIIGIVNNRKNRNLVILLAIISGAGIITLIGSDSKTSEAVFALLFVLVFLFPRILGKRNIRKRKKYEVMITYVLLLSTSIAFIFSHSISISDEALLSGIGRDSTLSGRTNVWENANTLINMKPIIGWSFDGRRSAFDEIEIGLPHFHNGYLDFMVRGGMVGLLILFSLIARTIWRIWRKAKRKPDIYAHFAAFIISLLVYNITEMTFGAWSNLMWIMLLFIYFLSERNRGHRRRKGRHTQIETTIH